MSDNSLLDAAKAAKRELELDLWTYRGYNAWFVLEAAIAAEEAKPKVERRLDVIAGSHFEIVHSETESPYCRCRHRHVYGIDEDEHVTVERPLPAKSRAEELADRLENIAETEARFSATDQETFQELEGK